MKQPFLISFVKVCILIGMAIGAAILALIATCVVPLSGLLFPGVDMREEAISAGVLAALAVLGVEYIALTLYCMMQTLSDDPFVEKNVRALRRMGFAALSVTALGLATLLFVPAPLAVVAALPIGMCGLFSLVLSNVFEKAVAYKKENDLTV